VTQRKGKKLNESVSWEMQRSEYAKQTYRCMKKIYVFNRCCGMQK